MPETPKTTPMRLEDVPADLVDVFWQAADRAVDYSAEGTFRQILAAVLPAVVPPGHVVVARADLEAYLDRGEDLAAETAALNRLRAALNGERP